MYKKLLTLTLVAASLAACGDDKPKQNVQLSCNDPAVLQNVRTLIQDSLKQKARHYSQNDNRQYVDADKVIAAGSELDIKLENAAATNETHPVCSAQLNVTVPYQVLQSAYNNAPLIYGQQDMNSILQRHTGSGKTAYNGSGVFSQTLRYKATPGEGGVSISLVDDLNNTADALSALLLPYGVKNHVLINGKPVSKEEALKQLRSEAKDADEQQPSPFEHDPQSILENNSASSVFDFSDQQQPAETISPVDTHNTPGLSAAELDQARNSYDAADGEINRIWNNIDQTVRKELVDEQRDWINQKNNSCRQAAARAGDPQQAEYLQLQCSTRMTRERIQYLKGYSIQ
ncbi:lysozyme inhibitor LprI family protein [Neisseria wadsworthii]|uniref:Lipoprotein n=1 Tax=Neisseria wadsworthii 9715 TaxID=1030841 RepID=G4CLT0_9NEIS|nr:lysozyme inhibitor LprI family protein [Neisseria wadsworthii]EGZ51288.1 lipoprotein [Neisseria wadsworthii 9715]QMT36122.1 DUF1311 domain-containing protein [Neisseria wadsworthii]